MVRIISKGSTIWILALLALAVAVTGCSTQVAAEAATGGPRYSGALDTTYENALDPVTQLALGTLSVEGSVDAVTAEQAAALLPLWQVLQGSDLQADAERYAVLAQIEIKMSGEQLSAIAAMQLTQADLQTWSQQEGQAVARTPTLDGAAVPESMPQMSADEDQAALREQAANLSAEDRAALREQAATMSDEDRAALREQFSASSGLGGGTSQGLLRAVVDLLSAQVDVAVDAVTQNEPQTSPASESQAAAPSSVDVASSEPVAAEPESAVAAPAVAASAPETESATTAADAASDYDSETVPAPAEQVDPPTETHYVVRAGNTLAAIAQAYGVTVAAIVEANDIQDPNAIHVGQELTIPDPALAPETVAAVGVTAAGSTESSSATSSAVVPALEWLPDDDPGPPLTIEVSANTATQDPLVEASRTYLVTGVVRNDGDETYAVSDILVTFYDASGFRGTFEPAIRQGVVVGGEYHWHGETEAEFAALLLAPGEEWPFRIEIIAQDMASFLIHPDAAPTGRESAPVTLSDVRLVDEGTGYLRISSTATNGNAFAVKNVTVSGALLDASGQIVSVGSVYVLQEDIAPGASVTFDLRVEKEAYASYQLYAQTERDWVYQ